MFLCWILLYMCICVFISHAQFSTDRAVYKYIVLCIIIMIGYYDLHVRLGTFMCENAWFPQPRHKIIATVSAHFLLIITTSSLFGRCRRKDFDICRHLSTSSFGGYGIDIRGLNTLAPLSCQDISNIDGTEKGAVNFSKCSLWIYPIPNSYTV